MISVDKPGTPQELVHVGVKGMKWGVRKNRVSDAAIGGLGISTTGSRERAAARRAGPPRITRTKAWKSWSKLAEMNVNHYNKSHTHQIGSKAASGLLLVIGAVTVAGIVKK